MTCFRRFRRVLSDISVSTRGAALAGIGLALLLGSSAQATEIEHGEAEQAPPGVVGDPAPAAVAPQAPISPARVVAHTAQLPKAAPRNNNKPLLAADLSKPAANQGVTTSSQGTAAAAATPAPKTKVAAPQPGAAGPAKRARLPLAPSAGEIRREIAARNGGPPTVNSANPSGVDAGKPQPATGARLQEQATTPPTQNPRSPARVDYTAGPTGPAGGNTAAQRKGAMIEATGPQQGVIRNQW